MGEWGRERIQEENGGGGLGVGENNALLPPSFLSPDSPPPSLYIRLLCSLVYALFYFHNVIVQKIRLFSGKR